MGAIIIQKEYGHCQEVYTPNIAFSAHCSADTVMNNHPAKCPRHCNSGRQLTTLPYVYERGYNKVLSMEIENL